MAAGKQAALVVSAHSADFVWRAGGAIALHAERGFQCRSSACPTASAGDPRSYGARAA